MSPSGFARLSLALTGLVFGGFGVALFVSPEMLASVGVEIARPAGAVELRAFYGGLELGMAAFFALAAAREAWHRPGLFVQVLALGGAAAGRVVGVLVGGGGEPMIWALTAAETAGAAVGLVALWWLGSERGRGTAD